MGGSESVKGSQHIKQSRFSDPNMDRESGGKSVNNKDFRIPIPISRVANACVPWKHTLKVISYKYVIDIYIYIERESSSNRVVVCWYTISHRVIRESLEGS